MSQPCRWSPHRPVLLRCPACPKLLANDDLHHQRTGHIPDETERHERQHRRRRHLRQVRFSIPA